LLQAAKINATATIVAVLAACEILFIVFPKDECTHHLQRGRASITELELSLRETIETQRLLVVVTALLGFGCQMLSFLTAPETAWLRISFVGPD
jgi:hypothetical protein